MSRKPSRASPARASRASCKSRSRCPPCARSCRRSSAEFPRALGLSLRRESDELHAMKLLIPLLFSAMLSAAAHAADATFYLGTYTKAGKSEGVYVGTLNTETGKLGPVKLAGEAKSPSFVALSPNGKYLYACGEGAGGTVISFSVNADVTLQKLNEGDTGGGGACHVWVDATG